MVRRLALIPLVFNLGLAVAAAQAAGNTAPAQGNAAVSQEAPKGPALHPTAVLHTTAGDLTCELFPDKAPKTVENFVGLATGQKDWTNSSNHQVQQHHPLYDGVIFHRVIPGFMIQGGDPLGTGEGDPGYQFEDELLPDLLFDRPGRLAMANAGPNTNGSQFFITEAQTPFLNPCFDEHGCLAGGRNVPKGTGYTIFGQCNDESVQLVKKIALGPCGGVECDGTNSTPDHPVKITHIEILPGFSGSLSEANITALLRSGISPTSAATLVKQQGVNFSLDNGSRTRLRDAGADADLLLAISTSNTKKP